MDLRIRKKLAAAIGLADLKKYGVPGDDSWRWREYGGARALDVDDITDAMIFSPTGREPTAKRVRRE